MIFLWSQDPSFLVLLYNHHLMAVEHNHVSILICGVLLIWQMGSSIATYCIFTPMWVTNDNVWYHINMQQHNKVDKPWNTINYRIQTKSIMFMVVQQCVYKYDGCGRYTRGNTLYPNKQFISTLVFLYGYTLKVTLFNSSFEIENLSIFVLYSHIYSIPQ